MSHNVTIWDRYSMWSPKAWFTQYHNNDLHCCSEQTNNYYKHIIICYLMSRLMIGSRGLIWTVTLPIADRKRQMNQHEADELAVYKCTATRLNQRLS